MTPEHHVHLERIIKESSYRIQSKYIKGQEEHGGALWTMDSAELLDNAIDEATDQLVYLLTLKEQLKHNRQSDAPEV